MDPEFKRILFRVMSFGSVILAIGAGTLFVAFRAYGPSHEKGRDLRATVLVAALLVFVLLVCLLLMRISMIR